MRSGVIPKRGLGMETIAGVFSAIARGLRGLFDLASMAVGVAPTSVALADAATVDTSGGDGARSFRCVGAEEVGSEERASNPATGLPLSGEGFSSVDVGGNLYGTR
jgi:hypothetical protein